MTNLDLRGKVLFAPTDEQQYDKPVPDLIKKRLNINYAGSVYSSR